MQHHQLPIGWPVSRRDIDDHLETVLRQDHDLHVDGLIAAVINRDLLPRRHDVEAFTGDDTRPGAGDDRPDHAGGSGRHDGAELMPPIGVPDASKNLHVVGSSTCGLEGVTGFNSPKPSNVFIGRWDYVLSGRRPSSSARIRRPPSGSPPTGKY